ncbi:MAG: hypothetical protein R2745_11485 [Vicinamibacterales bacterium]
MEEAHRQRATIVGLSGSVRGAARPRPGRSVRCRRVSTVAVAGMIALAVAAADAQPLGTFRWQQQPYCNVLTVAVVHAAGVYQVDGVDDQCAAARKASVVGLAFPNPDGSVGLGLTIVTTPGGTPLHLDATIDPGSGSGTWRDSGGNTGAFVLTPGTPVGGHPRPASRVEFPAGLSAGGTTIVNVAPPAAASDAATKGYVDAAIGSGIEFAASDAATSVSSTTATPTLALSLTLTAPGPGYVEVAFSSYLTISHSTGATSYVVCALKTDTSSVESPTNRIAGSRRFVPVLSHESSSAYYPHVDTRGVLPVAAAGPVTVYASCYRNSNPSSATLIYRSLTATFVPRRY